MVVIRVKHVSRKKNRESILEKGLLPSHPVKGERGNYTTYIDDEEFLNQPEGIYVSLDDGNNWEAWGRNMGEDEWVFPIVGDVQIDPIFESGVTLVYQGGIVAAEKLQLRSAEELDEKTRKRREEEKKKRDAKGKEFLDLIA